MIKISGKTQGILYIIVAAFGFAGMSLFVKLAGDLPAFQKAFFRNFVALIYISIIIFKYNIQRKSRLHPEKREYKTAVLPLFLRHARTFMQLLCDRQIKPAGRKYAQ